MEKKAHEQMFLFSVENEPTSVFEATAHRLERAGVRVVARMPLVGIIRGLADPFKKKELELLEGVKRIDPEGEMHIAGAASKH